MEVIVGGWQQLQMQSGRLGLEEAVVRGGRQCYYLLAPGQGVPNCHFLPALFHHLTYFCQYETRKNNTSIKILHIKCIPLTALHKMWSQFLFLFLSMKVEPRSLNFCVVKRYKFVALFPFCTPPAQAGAGCPQNAPKAVALFRNRSAAWLQGGQRLLLTIGRWHCCVMKPSGD